MTVSTTTTYNEATGAGGVKVFYFTFRCDDSSWVKVYLDDAVQGSGYTVALNADQSASPGGSVTFTTAPDGKDVLIKRQTSLTQEVNYTPYDAFPAETHELALDKNAMQNQDEAAARIEGDAAVQANVDAEEARAEAAEVALAASIATQVAAEAFARAAADAAIIASGATPADVGLAPVIATGTVQARTVNARAADEVWIEDFGEAGTGDWTTILNSAVTFLLGASGAGAGGTLRFKARTYRCDGKILFPNTGGAGKPFQPNMKWVGAAGNFTADVFSPSGTVLDLRYTGDAVGRIDTRGLGGWEATGITFGVLAGAGSTPIIQTTNTTLRIHHCGFYTYKTGQACDIDAIVCGGTHDNTTDGTDDSTFQGYGTIISENTFQGIRRGLYGRYYFNANAFINNTFWTACGSNLAGGAAVELIASPTNGTSGNTISGNLFEMMSYPYAIKLGDGAGAGVVFTTIVGNGLYDGSPGITLGGVYCDAEAQRNMIIAGHQDVNTGPAALGPGLGANTVITSAQGEASVFPGGIQCRDYGLELWASSTPHLDLRQEGTEQTFEMEAGGAASAPYMALSMTPDSTGTKEYLAGFTRHSGGPGYIDWNIPGTTRSRLSGSGNLTIYGPVAGHLRLACGDGSTEVVAVENGKVAFFGSTPVTKRTATDLAGVIQALKDYGLLT